MIRDANCVWHKLMIELFHRLRDQFEMLPSSSVLEPYSIMHRLLCYTSGHNTFLTSIFSLSFATILLSPSISETGIV